MNTKQLSEGIMKNSEIYHFRKLNLRVCESVFTKADLFTINCKEV